ncbi:hypothetical protein NQ166_12285 [Microbacterium sp. zg.Y1090]|uniref:hypothetical protein n=1 Tax=Microbacterium TaxID=33882 RepID=UPI00214BACC1|nr:MULTISPECIES: hypothetical protein [unclassified Microbacterium]MCR2813887.1 hypothetical protein [Microbacterium sp. zg.Y1084]MCR2819603.1 hypothetical protein [Microbacterium sp. zg.Y1090]MDL5487076.1 hypothetical protein [Microbacterium sp. zg-Y1211]WIM28151.1 hypothetical protein QNO26_13545 [Microbacterium sp. zg-Y1090]
MSEPVRRRPTPAVYRRRRLTVLLALLLVIAGVVLLVWQPWNADAAETGPRPEPTPAVSSPAPTPAPTTSAPPKEATPDAEVPEDPDAGSDAVGECTSGMVEVAAVTDKQSYPAGENPQLSISLTNTGGVACTMNVGTTTQVFTISSGDDVWWRSTDCQSEPSDQTVTIDAGQTVSSATPLTWDRTRSSVSTCGDTDRPVAPGGGSSFHLKVAIGGVQSAGSAQFLLQ